MVNLGELMRQFRQVALRGNPAECAEPMSGVTRQVQGLKSEGTFGGLKIVIDEPVVFGGTGLAPNPAEVALAALGASMEVTLRCYAEAQGVPVESISVALSGALDARGFFGTDPSIAPGFGPISATVTVESSAAPERVAELIEQVNRCCPVLDVFRSPQTVNVTLDHVAGQANRG
jgi:pyruvate dehydrogenase E2 component (dihydrolipoamide acetyltransferase)